MKRNPSIFSTKPGSQPVMLSEVEASHSAEASRRQSASKHLIPTLRAAILFAILTAFEMNVITVIPD